MYGPFVIQQSLPFATARLSAKGCRVGTAAGSEGESKTVYSWLIFSVLTLPPARRSSFSHLDSIPHILFPSPRAFQPVRPAGSGAAPAQAAPG